MLLLLLMLSVTPQTLIISILTLPFLPSLIYYYYIHNHNLSISLKKKKTLKNLLVWIPSRGAPRISDSLDHSQVLIFFVFGEVGRCWIRGFWSRFDWIWGFLGLWLKWSISIAQSPSATPPLTNPWQIPSIRNRGTGKPPISSRLHRASDPGRLWLTSWFLQRLSRLLGSCCSPMLKFWLVRVSNLEFWLWIWSKRRFLLPLGFICS